MSKSKIVFSNSEELLLSTGDVLIGVGLIQSEDGVSLSMSSATPLADSVHDGLIQSILEIVCNYPYFYGPSGIETIYNSSSVVKIVNI